FVVVISMDVRYVTRALEKVYEGVLIRSGEPSGLDYIEKIIQIPYRVRPVAEPAVSSFLWSQMSPEDPVTTDRPPAARTGGMDDRSGVQTEPGEPAGSRQPDRLQQGEESRTPTTGPYRTELRVLPTETKKFSSQDHALISACCAAFEVSPRTMKRLVNVFKLLKIIWYRQGLDDGPPEPVKKAMLALLVIAARYPEPMRQLLHATERRFMAAEAEAGRRVVEFLVERVHEHAPRALIARDWQEVETALRNPSLISQELTFEELHERHLHEVSSFSFIGESDPEREAALRRDFYRPAPSEATQTVSTAGANSMEGALTTQDPAGPGQPS
ncbi:MAG: P-loop NTPase fold protein, partial [Pseudomonadota bacterium]